MRINSVRGLFVAIALSALATAANAQQQKLVVAIGAESLIYMPAYIAKEKGYFAEEGFDAEVRLFRGGPQALAGVMGGDAHIYLGSPPTAMKAILQGQAIKVFGSNQTEIPSNIVIQGELAKKANINAGSSIQDKIKALRGSTMGVNAVGSSLDQLLRYVAVYGGLDPDKDMTITPVSTPSAMLGSFEQKRIDGFVFSSPTSDIAVDSFGGMMLINFSKGEFAPMRGFIFLSMISRSDWLKENPDRAAKAVRAFWKAQQLINEKPEEARASLRTVFPKMEEKAFNYGFAANAATIPVTVRIDPKGIELTRVFSEQAEKIKLDLKDSDVYTNEYVDRAEKMGILK